MKWVFALAVITALAMLWSLWGRDWLKSRGLASGFFAWLEPVEIALWKNSKTIFKARFLMVLGFLSTILTQAGAIDITPLMPFVPDAWEPTLRVIWNMLPIIIVGVGWVDEQLRKETTKPLEQVALPEVKPTAVVVAEIKAEQAKAELSAVIDEAKAEGKI